ncbi:MAG: serine/threonine-protein kinase [Elainellaceae cyanobacterium]
MSLCINPRCFQPDHPQNDATLFCQSCGSDLVLQSRYRVMRLLSDMSGFGRVYEAFERSTPKLLKVLKERHSSNSKAIELFEQEAAVLARLRHPGIPLVEPDGCFQFLPREGDPLHCIVMEKIDGPNLLEWMRQQGGYPISEEQALNWLQQLAKILHLIHQQNYFHRDIKPENIMLRSSGQLVLVDFGAAREMTYTYFAQLGGTGGITRISSAGYTPPEQERGQAVPQSDFYALGCTFLFLLTGKSPNTPDIYDSLNNQISWRQYAPHVSSQLADFIDRLIAPRAAARPKSTEELMDELDQLVTSQRTFSPQGETAGENGSGELGSFAPPRPPPISSKETQPPPQTIAQAPSTLMQPLPSPLRRWGWLVGLGLVAIASIPPLWVMNRQGIISIPWVSGKPIDAEPYEIGISLAAHSSDLRVLTLSGDQQILASGGNDRTIYLWSMVSQDILQTLNAHESPINALAISPNGRYLASGGDDLYMIVWDIETGRQLQTLTGHGQSVNDLLFTSDNQTLISASADRTIKTWDWESGQERQTLNGHSGFINAIALSPDGQTLVSGSADTAIKIWDLATGQEIGQLLGHTSFVNDLAISPDGQWLASAAADGTIKIWNLGTRKEIRTIDEHESYVNQVLFSPDGRTLISSSADQTIRFWDVSSGELQISIPWEGVFVNAIAVKFEGPTWQFFAGGKGSDEIQSWQLIR